MPGKRKADDAMSAAEPQEKLSKKARLELARKRAAEYARRDKETIEKSRGNKSGGLSPKAQNKTVKNGVVENHDLSVTPESKKSPQKKMTLSERRKIAKENAKDFAARDKAALESKKKAPLKQNFGTVIDPNEVEAYERMRQTQRVVMREQEPIAEKSDIPTIPNSSKYSEGNDDQSLLSTDEEVNEDDMPPPPPALMAQVSQQVMMNAQNEDSDVVDQVSIEDDSQTEEHSKHQNMDEKKEVPLHEPEQQEKKSKSRYLPRLTSFVIIFVAIIAIILKLPAPSDEKNLSLGDRILSEEPPCFFNSESEHEEGCSTDNGGTECPEGGVCEGGKLVACDNVFQDVSHLGDKCVWDEKYFPMKTALINQLVSHASQICDQSSKPSFKYAILQKEQPTLLEEESEDLVEALVKEGFVVHEREGLYVGLPEGFPVGLPIYCLLGNIGQWVLQEVGLLLLGVLRFIFSNLLGFASTYPKLFAFNSVFLLCFLKYRKLRAAKKKHQEDICRTREIAYMTLEESSGASHHAIHIRDQIAMQFYPNDKKLRFQFQKNVWPKIVDDVKRDTRVRKFQSINKDGKPRDMWEWSAVSKTTNSAKSN